MSKPCRPFSVRLLPETVTTHHAVITQSCIDERVQCAKEMAVGVLADCIGREEATGGAAASSFSTSTDAAGNKESTAATDANANEVPVGDTFSGDDSSNQFGALVRGLSEQELVLRQPRPYLRESIRQAVQMVVELGESKRLYGVLCGVLREHAVVVVQRIIDTVRSNMARDESDPRALWVLVSHWAQYRQAVQEIELVWVHLDRRYVLMETRYKSISGVAMSILWSVLKRERNLHLNPSFASGPSRASQAPTYEVDVAVEEEEDEEEQHNRSGTGSTLLQMAHQDFLNSVRRQRDGDVHVECAPLRRYVALCLEFDIYFSQLEPMLLEETTGYYNQETARSVAGETLATFFKRCERRLLEERARVKAYLTSRSAESMEAAVERSLLDTHAETVVLRDFGKFALAEDYDAIHLAWQLLSLRHVSAVSVLQTAMRQYITETAERYAAKSVGATGGSAHDFANLRDLIALKGKCDALIATAFANEDVFHGAKRESLEAGLQAHKNEVARLLARFLDTYLRKGVRPSASKADISAAVDGVLGVFGHFPGKNLFLDFYWRDLARRLLQQRCVAPDEDTKIVRYVKALCGSSQAFKAEGVMNDMQNSGEINKNYQKWLTTPKATPVDSAAAATSSTVMTPEKASVVQFYVLAKSLWPEWVPIEMNLPQIVKPFIASFEEFYVANHTYRHLTWYHNLSSCELVGHFAGGRKNIFASFIQSIILLIVDSVTSGGSTTTASSANDNEMNSTNTTSSSNGKLSSISVGDLCARLGLNLNSAETTAALLSLTQGATHLLLRTPETHATEARSPRSRLPAASDPTDVNADEASAVPGGAEKGQKRQREPVQGISAGDLLSINDGFTSAAESVRVPNYPMRSSGGAVEDAHHDESAAANNGASSEAPAGATRTYAIEAAIVRYMKTKERCTHDELMTAVMASAKKPLSIANVKRSIESAIERGFMVRAGNDAYEYLP